MKKTVKDLNLLHTQKNKKLNVPMHTGTLGCPTAQAISSQPKEPSSCPCLEHLARRNNLID